MTGPPDTRLGEAAPPAVPGLRVVLDARPLQAPERAPLAAAYLDGLLGAFDAAPLAGESFAFLIGSDLDDPTVRYENLEVVGRRQLPPTRLLRSGAMTVDPFLLRGAAVGSAWRAERGGAAGAVYHAVGGSPLPIASGLPVVATLLDLAAWEMPDAFQRSVAGRFGQRLRAQLLRDAAAVIVGSDATARAARRLLRIRRERLHVVRLAPRPGFGPGPSDGSAVAAEVALRGRLGIADRYLVFTGRFDARLDLDTLLRALASLAADGPPERVRRGDRLAAARPARRRQSRRSCLDRPGRGQEGDRRVPGLRARPSGRGPGRARPRRARGDPPGRLGGGRPAGHRGDRQRDAGHRVIGRATPRADRSGRAAGRAARPEAARRRAGDAVGR